MLQKIMEVSTGVYILWGLGVLGVLMKILANAYMSKMVRASTNLGETKRKKLRNMCRQYENKKGFGLCGGECRKLCAGVKIPDAPDGILEPERNRVVARRLWHDGRSVSVLRSKLERQSGHAVFLSE